MDRSIVAKRTDELQTSIVNKKSWIGILYMKAVCDDLAEWLTYSL